MIGAVTQGVGALSTPANLLTIARLVTSPFLFWMILAADDSAGTSWSAFVFGWILGATDFYDGKLARRANRVSRSGAFLDPLADKVVVLGAMICLVSVDRYWWLPVALVAAREVVITVWRTWWARRGLAVPARRSAKYKTLVQGLALAAAVCPLLEEQTAAVTALLWVAVAFTIVSGAQYVLDGRAATSVTGSRSHA